MFKEIINDYDSVLTDVEKQVLTFLDNGRTISSISYELNVTKSFVKYRKTKKYLKALEERLAKFQVDKEFGDAVENVLPTCNSLNNVCQVLGLRGVDGYYKKIIKVINERKLDTKHFNTLNKNNFFKQISDDDFFVNGVHRNGVSIKQRLIEKGLKEYKCEICGISEWNGKPLSLQIHHINGNHNDNRLENLQLLCPNCHSQTDSYANKNNCIVKKTKRFSISERIKNIIEKQKNETFNPQQPIIIPRNKEKYCLVCGKKIEGYGKKYCSLECARIASRKNDITKEELIQSFKEDCNFSQIGKKYNVSDNAIRKICKRYNIPIHTRELKEYLLKI